MTSRPFETTNKTFISEKNEAFLLLYYQMNEQETTILYQSKN